MSRRTTRAAAADVEMKTSEPRAKGSKRSRGKATESDGEEDVDTVAVAVPRAKRQHTAAPSSAAAAAGAAASSAAASAAFPEQSDEDVADDDAAGVTADGEEEDVEALAAAQGLSVYEWNRQQNIRLKNEQLSLLNLSGMASEIGLKRAAAAPRSASRSKAKKIPTEGTRRSLRSSGAPTEIYVPELNTAASSGWGRPDRPEGPLTLQDALADKEQDDAENKEMDSVLTTLRDALNIAEGDTHAKAAKAVENSYAQPRAVTQSIMRMLGEGPKIIKSRATVLQYHPTVSLTSDRSLLAAGDKNGYVSLATFQNDCSQSTWLSSVQTAQYRPHVGSVVDLHFGRESHVLYSGSRDGSVRRLDAVAGIWDEVFVEDENDGASLSAMELSADRNTLYVADRAGIVHVIDPRSAAAASGVKAAQKLTLSSNAINSLSLNPLDEHMMASAGKERLVRVWDLRNVKTDKPLAEWSHGYSINAVYFSPSGRMMASTSYDDTIKLFSCVNDSGALLTPSLWAPPVVIKHNNHTGRWVTTFRAVFAPRDVALAIGNMDRPIDVFTFPNVAPAAPNPFAAATGQTSTGAGAAAAAASSSSNGIGGRGKKGGSSSFSAAGPGVKPPTPGPAMNLYHAEYVTSIPAAVAWHPTRVQVAGCTGSGRLYCYGAGVK